jgi:hypothetical protein
VDAPHPYSTDLGPAVDLHFQIKNSGASPVCFCSQDITAITYCGRFTDNYHTPYTCTPYAPTALPGVWLVRLTDANMNPLPNLPTLAFDGYIGHSGTVACVADKPPNLSSAQGDFLGVGCTETLTVSGILLAKFNLNYNAGITGAFNIEVCANADLLGATATPCVSSSFIVCGDGYSLCNGSCVDYSTDVNHCGACNPSLPCPVGASCVNSACVCPRLWPPGTESN